MATTREIEERRFAAIQALRAVVDCLRESNPQLVFSGAKDSVLETAKMQAIATRWADKAADVLLDALELAARVTSDAVSLFDVESDAQGRGTPAAD